MQGYGEYAASQAEWLGALPSHWECKKIGSLFTERKTKVSDKDYSPLSVTKMGILPQLEHAAKSNDGDNRKLVCAGDFVINRQERFLWCIGIGWFSFSYQSNSDAERTME